MEEMVSSLLLLVMDEVTNSKPTIAVGAAILWVPPDGSTLKQMVLVASSNAQEVSARSFHPTSVLVVERIGEFRKTLQRPVGSGVTVCPTS